MPILREEYGVRGLLLPTDYYHSVAVVKKGTLDGRNGTRNVRTMEDLGPKWNKWTRQMEPGLKACFAKVCFIDYITFTDPFVQGALKS